MTAQTAENAKSLHDEVVAELSSFAQRLRPKTAADSDDRIFLDGLLRDAFLLERHAERDLDVEDSAWMAPYLATIADKMELARRILNTDSSVVESYAGRIKELRGRNDALALLRNDLKSIVLSTTFHEQVENRYDLENLKAIVEGQRFLINGLDGAAPEWILATQTLEIFSLQRAIDVAQKSNESESPLDSAIQSLSQLLSNFLDSETPVVGALPDDKCLAVKGRRRDFKLSEGLISKVLCPQFSCHGKALNGAVVQVSAGLQLKLVPTIDSILESCPKQRQLDVRVMLEPSLETLCRALENPDSSDADLARRCLETLALVLPAIDSTDDQSKLVSVLQEDFQGHDCQWHLAVAAAPYDEGPQYERRDVFSFDIDADHIVKLVRPGLSLDGELVHPAIVQVSQGQPPASDIDELYEFLPDDDERAAHFKERIKRAQLLSAGDAGAQLSRELADLALYLKDDYLCDAGRLAIRMVIHSPPVDLLSAPGWESLNEFLVEQLDLLLEDGESGENSIFFLTRPYLQGLRIHSFQGAEMRSLGESLSALLSLYDEALAAAAREWLYGRLERLSNDWKAVEGYSRRLLRVAAKALNQFRENGEENATLELTGALKNAGIHVFPESFEFMEHCFAPQSCFHVFEAEYKNKKRRTVIGKDVYPCLTLTDNNEAVNQANTETGAVTLSLGEEPPLIHWLNEKETRDSRIGKVCDHLIREFTILDKKKLELELAGRADSERDFVSKLGRMLVATLGYSGWNRSAEDRAVFAPLFELLKENYQLILYPGYWTYREMRALTKLFGDEQIKIELSRDGQAGMKIESHGLSYRGELLTPLNIHWTVGASPPYVAWLKENLAWFNKVISGEELELRVSSSVRDAILDFESPDASGLVAVVRSLEVILDWLASQQKEWLDQFCEVLIQAPELELEVFPRPGQCYSREHLLNVLERVSGRCPFELVKDSGGGDGEAVFIEKMAFFQGGKLLSSAPKARFSFTALPIAYLDLNDKLSPIFESAEVLPSVKDQLQMVLTRMALSDQSKQGALELSVFRILWDAHLYDPTFPESAENPLYKASLSLAQKLSQTDVLVIERFEGMKEIAAVHKKYSTEQVEIEDAFASPGTPEIIEARRPFVALEGRALQTGALLRGVVTSDEVMLEYDRILSNAFHRLKSWQSGAKSTIESLFDEKQTLVISRTLKRIADTRGRMFKLAKEKKKSLPAKTSRRDVIRFIIDQVHRIDDCLSILSDKNHRGYFGELVFKDVVYRSAGPYLSKEYGISIDMSVVAGADSQALVGRYKKESSGPKPTREHRRIYSVVVPCYKQDGVTIRPATVRLGDY
ncbi:MAG: hypothetical protein P1V97_00800 [Planctomycetota bacterium]|nr:hypothetical protein [Planctomycetota bacterium]